MTLNEYNGLISVLQDISSSLDCIADALEAIGARLSEPSPGEPS